MQLKGSDFFTSGCTESTQCGWVQSTTALFFCALLISFVLVVRTGMLALRRPATWCSSRRIDFSGRLSRFWHDAAAPVKGPKYRFYERKGPGVALTLQSGLAW